MFAGRTPTQGPGYPEGMSPQCRVSGGGRACNEPRGSAPPRALPRVAGGAAMPEAQGAMEATLRAVMDGDGDDRGFLEGLSEAAQCYHVIRTLASRSKWVPKIQGAPSCRVEQEAPRQLVDALREVDGALGNAATWGLKRKAEHLEGEASEGLIAVSRRALEKVLSDTYSRKLVAIHMPSDSPQPRVRGPAAHHARSEAGGVLGGGATHRVGKAAAGTGRTTSGT